MKKKLKKYKKLPLIIAFCLGTASGVGFKENFNIDLSSIISQPSAPTNNIEWKNVPGDNVADINVCFTPPAGCGLLIAEEISKAKETIYVQAFGLTSQKIVDQLIRAKNNGVEIKVLLDRSNLHDKYSKMHDLTRAGIDVSIDKVPGIAHNKIMIIDKKKVITGSFNFTNAADNRNTENVVLINNSEIAKTYLQNWLSRKAKN